jgi:hypothetical protein
MEWCSLALPARTGAILAASQRSTRKRGRCSGDLNGDLLFFDAATGNLLHRITTHQPVGGGVIAYEQGGSQRIAVAAGLESPLLQTHGQPRVVVLGL